MICKDHQAENALIKFRIDVDYPYPSRLRSFIYTTLGIKFGKDYLRNSKVLARMINESPKEVKAFWFFTPKTIPDKELMCLLNKERHEIALHIANKAVEEIAVMEKATGRKLKYFSIHGTARFLARLMWKRWNYKAPSIPNNYPLISFHNFSTFGLDAYCYRHTTKQAIKATNEAIIDAKILHVHPIWLFQRGKMNHRGPYYETLRTILEVDDDLKGLSVSKKSFFKIAKIIWEYNTSIFPTKSRIEKLHERNIDIFTFIEGKWSGTIENVPKEWATTKEDIAYIEIHSYAEWLERIGKKTRNMIRKANKAGIKTKIVEPNDIFAEGVRRIFNETPLRQGRGFPHYGDSLAQVRNQLSLLENCTYIGASLQDELVGFVQLAHGDNLTNISQILSLQKYWDKAINNALIAKTIEVCAEKGIRRIMYGGMGNHPSLDNFKQSNGFTQFRLTRYYIPLTRRGKTATKFGMHKEIGDNLPSAIKYPLIRLYNWTSRTRTKAKLRFRREKAI